MAYRRLPLAVMIILAGLPLYLLRFSVLGVPFTFLEAMILIAFFTWFFKESGFRKFLCGEYHLKDYLGNRKRRLPYPFWIEAILVIVCALAGAAVAGFSLPALGAWRAYFFEPLLLFILLLNVFQDRKGIKKIVVSLCAGALAVSLYAIWQKITGLGIANEFWAAAAGRRTVSFFGYPNAVGLYLAPIIMLAVGYLYKDFSAKKKGENIFFALTILLSLSAIYFARSEGALVAVAAALLAFGFFAGKAPRIAVLIFVLAFSGSLALSAPVREKVFEKATLMDLSGQIRRQQWQETWQMLSAGRFLSGAGLANYKEAVLPYHQEGIFVNDGDPDFRRKIVIFDDKYRAEHWQPVEIYLYPHNLALNFWSELGFFGMLIFIWLFLKAIFVSFADFRAQMSKYTKDGCHPFVSLGIAGAFLTMIIHGLVDVPYFKNDLAVFFWVLLAMVGIIHLQRRKIKTRSQIAVKK